MTYVSALNPDAMWQQGIDVGDVRIVVHAVKCKGLTVNLDGSIVKQWSNKADMVPMQVMLLTAF